MALMVPDGIDVGEYLCDLLPILDRLFEFDPFNNQSCMHRIEIDNNNICSKNNEHDKEHANVMITDETVANKENVEIIEESRDFAAANLNRPQRAIKRPWE